MSIDGWDVLERARELSARGQPCALATVVWRRGPSSGKQGYRAVITETGQVHGWIGGACAEPAVVREARRVLADGTPHLMYLGTSEELETAGREGVSSVPISCQGQGALEIFIEPVTPRVRLAVIGNSPLTETLTAMADALGWATVAVDPAAGLDLDAAGVNERSFVVVATQGHGDEDALAAALAIRPAYLGLVGSRERGASVLGYLADRGADPQLLRQVQVPAGLDLGAVSHREIAVAILGELVRRRAAGELRPATTGTTATAATGPSETVDPVCGMTVEIGAGGHAAEHDGTVYHFCCPVCRDAFERDPAAYITQKVPRC